MAYSATRSGAHMVKNSLKQNQKPEKYQKMQETHMKKRKHLETISRCSNANANDYEVKAEGGGAGGFVVCQTRGQQPQAACSNPDMLQ